ncbi:MAG: DUF3050 domain-containing protein [Cryomorphaceae bacterium]|nr:DUF3050 domain-containing protein [Cryomorphaceae bacterium]
MSRIATIEQRIAPLREQLKNHNLYKRFNSVADICVFTESHVFAVWDFMSLLKSLQQQLTCTSLPWVPAPNPSLARFINEIVHGEESDVNELNEPKSHFEMYLEAMQQLGANTSSIDTFIFHIRAGARPVEAFEFVNVPQAVRDFVRHTFAVIDSKKPHLVASAFTFGREDVIPDMFIAILKEAGQSQYTKFLYYLERHIELDGDEHGPLALKLISALCGDDDKKWQEVEDTAVHALEMRIALWDGILEQITNQIEVA